jgi:hypothetical protein
VLVCSRLTLKQFQRPHISKVLPKAVVLSAQLAGIFAQIAGHEVLVAVFLVAKLFGSDHFFPELEEALGRFQVVGAGETDGERQLHPLQPLTVLVSYGSSFLLTLVPRGSTIPTNRLSEEQFPPFGTQHPLRRWSLTLGPGVALSQKI